MQKFKTISVILIVVLVLFGCATSKNRAGAEFGINAEAVTEGILISFSNIPADATHMWLSVSSWDEDAESINYRNYYSAFAGITVPSVKGWVHSVEKLDEVKQTGKVIFPVAKPGQKYHVSAIVHNEEEMRKLRENSRDGSDSVMRQAAVECIAENGVYFDRDAVKLDLSKDKSAVTLSREPVFSSELTFDKQKYSYGVTVRPFENAGLGIGDHHVPKGLSSDGLSWKFEPAMTEVCFAGDEWLEEGVVYPAWAQAYVNIVYDEILWTVEIAKTEEFDYSL